MTFKIGKYVIENEKCYQALKSSGADSKFVLKKIDKNSDMKISEDELVEIIEDSGGFEDDTANSTNSTNNSNAQTVSQEQAILNSLKKYDEQNLELESQLARLYAEMAKTEDVEGVDSILSSIDGVVKQIDSNRNEIYNLLVQSEELARSAASAAQSSSNTNSGSNVSSNNGYPGLTTGTGLKGGSEFGNSVVKVAQSYVGRLKESDGSYLKVTNGRREAWCADFVTYVVKQTCKQTGTSLNGFGSASVSGLLAWGQANKCYINVNSGGNRAQTITKNVRPGDIMIEKSNGASHTGIVAKVYSDGSFDTIEGNTSDQCLRRHYPASNPKLSGFIKIT